MACKELRTVFVTDAIEEDDRVFSALKEMEQLCIIGIADLTGKFSFLKGQQKHHFFATQDLAKLLALPDIHLIVNACKAKEVGEQLSAFKAEETELVSLYESNFIMALIKSLERLLEVKKLKGELWAILNAVQDAIEVADNDGRIKYVNPAFTKVTGIPEKERVGKNIFEVSPQGALARSLIKQKPVIGYRTHVGGSDVEVISHASPIVVEGEMEGAVVVFQPINDILKLMDELQKSNTIIANLYETIDQITACKYYFHDLIGQSKIFKATLESAKKAARSEAPILITGESGTGKDIYAQAIHNASNRSSKPFIKINCSAIPEALWETEFFGYEKGSFSSATKTKMGKVELAQGGTLFLDGLGEMNLKFQEKLLRFLRHGEFQRIGSKEVLRANVRVIAATSLNLQRLVQKGLFLEELYFLLQTVKLTIPPLRQRLEDLPLLVDFFIEIFNRKLGKKVHGITPEALQFLINYDWPGNIKELEHVMEKAMVLADGSLVQQGHLSPYIGKFGNLGVSQYSEVIPLDKMEQMMLKTALSRFGDTLEGKKKAAKALNISLATLYNKIKKYKVNL